KYLVEHGADIEVANQHGHTSLMIAAYRQKVDVVKYLISCGADVNRSSKKGNTAMHDAVEGENLEVCALLLNAGARLVPDEFGVCPLMCAVMIGADWVEEQVERFEVAQVYEGHKEIQTLEDIAAIEDSPDAIRLQAS
ncbi:ankyrin repeat protein, partial [Ancylostoma duodenale]